MPAWTFWPVISSPHDTDTLLCFFCSTLGADSYSTGIFSYTATPDRAKFKRLFCLAWEKKKKILAPSPFDVFPLACSQASRAHSVFWFVREERELFCESRAMAGLTRPRSLVKSVTLTYKLPRSLYSVGKRSSLPLLNHSNDLMHGRKGWRADVPRTNSHKLWTFCNRRRSEEVLQ